MTFSADTSHHISGPLSPALLDGITDAVISAAHPQARADVVCQLVHEIYESIAWMHVSTDDELVSLRTIVESANAHQERLAAGDLPTSTPSGTAP